jgi:MSHA pilin protein MshA
MNKSMRGFTLVELVVVVVILGVLAAMALPQFIDMGGSARTAAINSLGGSVASASALPVPIPISPGSPWMVARSTCRTVIRTGGVTELV